MRVQFQQLTEPIDRARHEMTDLALILSSLTIPTQLKSLAPRSRRLPLSAWSVSTTPRACGDPAPSQI
jgi:hypothetical protein